MEGSRASAIVGIWIVHSQVVVTHRGLVHHVRVGHERVALAGEGLGLLVLDPFLLAGLVPGTPIGAGPERVQRPALD